MIPDVAQAGMPMVYVSELARMRVQAISFFLAGLLLSAGVIQLLWNYLRSDFPALPHDANKALGPWGYPANWRDPALGLNRSPDGFGNGMGKGANFSFADGSVRFLANAVSPEVLKALSTPAGGEMVQNQSLGVEN
jgi:prepilin-type processing-associated H-X9-DG protein